LSEPILIFLGHFLFNMKEIFKDIPNYEGIYQVSNLGRVKSLERIAIRKNTGNFLVKEKILVNIPMGTLNNQYYAVNLQNKGIMKTIKVHQLVAMAFLGHMPDGTHRIEIDHIDENKFNNNLNNLQLLETREHRAKTAKNKKKSSQYTGVTKKGNKWQSGFKTNGKFTHLGVFLTEIEAHEAYKMALSALKK
jgi:hypothetical protein